MASLYVLGEAMKVTYHDSTRQCSIADKKLVSLDSAAARYACPYCHGGITVQKVGEVWRLHCPQCGDPLYQVASKYAGRSSRIFPVDESAKKSEKDLFG